MLPRLLDASYGEVCRLRPSKLSVKLKLTPLSTATMHLPEGEPTISIRQWVELYGPFGSLGLFRVSAVKTEPGDGQDINLEHGIVTLGDRLTAADTTLTGTPYAIMGSLLGYQSQWQRGTVPDTGSYSVPVNRSNVLSGVLDLLKQMSGYGLTYDFSTWEIGISALETTPSSECRMRRNVESVHITLDDNDLCTRVYAVGLTDGYMDADTVSTWGVIAKNLGTSDDAAEADVQAYATEYLAQYKNPRASIEITALNLAEKTGEALDTFTVGKLCRVALPDWDYTTEQRIVTVHYPDILGNPEDVRLSLSNAPRDLSHTLAGINNDLYGTSTAVSGGRGGGGSSGKGKLEEYHTAILRNTDSVEILAWDVSDLDAELSTAKTSITVNADNIELKVSKNGVISSINQTSESITISASRIDLSGYVTASQLSSSLALIGVSEITDLTVGTHLQCNGGATFAGSLSIGGVLYYDGDTVAKSSKTVVTAVSLSKYWTTINGTQVLTNVLLNSSDSSISYYN